MLQLFKLPLQLLLVQSSKRCQLYILHLVQHHQLFGLNECPQELFLQNLVLMDQSSFSHFFLQYLVGEVPIFSKHTRNHVQESQRQCLFIDLLQQFIKSTLSELQSNGVALKSFEKNGSFCLEKHPLPIDLVDHRSVLNASIEQEVPSNLFMVESESSFMKEELDVENGQVQMGT